MGLNSLPPRKVCSTGTVYWPGTRRCREPTEQEREPKVPMRTAGSPTAHSNQTPLTRQHVVGQSTARVAPMRSARPERLQRRKRPTRDSPGRHAVREKSIELGRAKAAHVASRELPLQLPRRALRHRAAPRKLPRCSTFASLGPARDSCA